MTEHPTIEDILGPGGLLAGSLPNYEHRHQQLEMAKAVEHALAERQPLVVEAATGTGKTLAYLVPAILSGKRVVVSTGTKALQDQLFHKDIPFLQSQWPTEIKAVQLKGRRNYLCRLRFEEMKSNPVFRSREDHALWPRILSWAAHTETGDRAEIDGLPDDWSTWNDLSIGTEGCLGQKCPHYDACHVTKARRKAAMAEIIVVNHHLYFADLALKSGGHAELLPNYDAVVFDEAHNLEETATSYFGFQVSNYRFVELIGDIRRALETENLDDEDLEDGLTVLDKAYKTYLSNLTFGLYDGRYELAPHLEGPAGELSRDALRELSDALVEVARLVKASKLPDTSERLMDRAGELLSDLKFLTNCSDPKYVYFLELRDRGTFLQAAPIDIAELLRAKLLEAHDSLVFTSATLSTGGNFDYFRQRMGMTGGDEEYRVDTLLLPAVFDYAKQSLVYIPNRLPAPNHPEWLDNLCVVVKYLLELSEGRAFVLFTSYTNMQAAWDTLADELDYPCFKQGDMSKREILETFRATPNAVLFATASFWEGVDVVGDSLSMVIIDKLPFANPSDPLTRARLALLDESGRNAFMEYTVPQAALTLKQGFGRLIRSGSDTGVVAILDSRIAHKRYGRYFLDSLPPAPVVWRAAQVRDWWRGIRGSG